MIAAALIIIFVVVRYISGTGQQATSQGDLLVLQTQAELVKSSFDAKGWWTDNTNVTVSSDGTTLTLEVPGVTPNPKYTIPPEYTELRTYGPTVFPSDTNNTNKVDIIEAYNLCQAGNVTACQVFGVLAGSTS